MFVFLCLIDTLFSIALICFSSFSIAIKFLLYFLAIYDVVPLPANGSNIISFLFENPNIILFKSSSGFCVG